MDARPLVSIVDVTKIYGAGHSEVAALRGVSLDVRAGEKVALLGKSGSGKSTLMNLVGGLDRPTTGSIGVAGADLAQMSRSELAAYRRDRVGFVFQAFNLVATRTAVENVELPLIFAGVSPRRRRDQATRALEAVGLIERVDHRPSELSGGEQQRVAIARALINTPSLLLADEPTGNLDSDTSGQILDLLRTHLAAHGTTVLLVTHDEDLATRFADRIVRMQDGVLVP